MQHKKTYIKIVTLLFTLAFSQTINAATFPIIQDFSGTKPSTWELRASSTWNTTVSGDQTVRLTTAIQGNSGLAFYNDPFSSSLGIVTQVRYYAGGGDGADGFSFFLVDGDLVDQTNIAAGAAGGALGYMQNGSLTPGVPYGYLGVGFDEFGGNASANGNFSQPQVPDSVVLHGAGNDITGYPYLTHRDVANDFGQSIDGGWRLARITVLPNGGSGSIVRVEMSWDEGATWQTIINNYEYNQVMPTNLKLGFAASTGAATNIHAIGDLSVTVPADLQMSAITSPSGTYKRGDDITYAYQVLNAGPNAAGTTTITNSLPIGDSGFSNITWTAVTSTGTTISGDATNVSSIPVNLPNGVSVTVTVHAKIGKNVISTDSLYINLAAVPGTGVSDPSPTSGQLAVSLSVDVPTPVIDSALDVIESFGASSGYAYGTGTVPTVGIYASSSVTGVTSDNLSAVNAAVAAYGPGAGLTIQRLQSIIDGVIYALAHPVSVSVAMIGGAATMGCKDPNASNYNYFSTGLQSLCAYGSAAPIPTLMTIASKPSPVRDLSWGMTGADVTVLQKFLISANTGKEAKALAKIGATGYFGNATKKTLVEYQKKNKISATGNLGPITRKSMISLKI